MNRYFSVKGILFPVFAVLAILIYLLDPFSWLDYLLGDFYYKVASPVSQGIYVIELEDGAQRTAEEQQSWTHITAAWLLSSLNADEASRPAVIGLDMPLYSWNNDESDEALLSAVRGAPNLVVSTRLAHPELSRGPGGIWAKGPGLPEQLPAGVQGLPSGFSDLFSDPDGRFRRGLYRVGENSAPQYCFAAAVYQKYLQSAGAASFSDPPLDGQGMWRFKFADDAENYRHNIRFSDLFSGKVPLSTFKDAVVLIGARPAQTASDYTTPVNGEPVFDTLLQAQLVQSLFDQNFLFYVPRLIQALLLAAILVVLRFAYTSFSLAVRIGALAGATVVYILLTFLLFLMGIQLDIVYLPFAAALLFVGMLFNDTIDSWAQQFMNWFALRRYLSPETTHNLKDAEIELEPHKQNIAVLFVDVRGFTPLSESLSPSQLSEVLKEYLTLTASAIFNNGGTLDKFIGDATMGFFNAPVEQEDYIYRAVKAAMDITAGSDRINAMFKEKFDRSVRFGVGVHFGEAVVGMIGPPFRRDYTAIGDTVNTAARLESVADPGQILISMKVCAALEGRLKASYVGERPIKGKSKPMILYQVDSLDGITPSGKPAEDGVQPLRAHQQNNEDA